MMFLSRDPAIDSVDDRKGSTAQPRDIVINESVSFINNSKIILYNFILLFKITFNIVLFIV